MTTGTPYPTAPPPPPPTYAPPPVMYAPLGGRLLALKIVFGFMVAVSAAAVVSGVFELRLLDNMIAGGNVSDSEIDNNDIRQGLVGFAQFLTWIGCVVVFMMWLWRAYGNVDAVAPGVRRYDRGWAIGSWFVPILNLFRPKQIVNDIWRAGGPPPEPSLLLGVWWTLWLITNWVANFALRGAFSDQSPEEVRNGTIAYLITDGIDIVAALLAIFVAITLTRRLDAQAAAGPPPPPNIWPPPQEPASDSSWPTAVGEGPPVPPPLSGR